MSTSRRERFEEQLRALQSDISHLSQKLAAPVTAAADTSSSSSLPQNVSARDQSVNLNTSSITSADYISGTESGQIARLKRDLHLAARERDDANFKLEQMNRELETLRAIAKEHGKLKISHEQLKQDHDALRISFESSERIRKQQKELISLLQRSHVVEDHHSIAGSSVHSVGSGNIRHVQSASPGGGASLLSGSAVESGGASRGIGGGSGIPAAVTVAAENSSWLNSFGTGSVEEPVHHLRGHPGGPLRRKKTRRSSKSRQLGDSVGFYASKQAVVAPAAAKLSSTVSRQIQGAAGTGPTSSSKPHKMHEPPTTEAVGRRSVSPHVTRSAVTTARGSYTTSAPAQPVARRHRMSVDSARANSASASAASLDRQRRHSSPPLMQHSTANNNNNNTFLSSSSELLPVRRATYDAADVGAGTFGGDGMSSGRPPLARRTGTPSHHHSAHHQSHDNTPPSRHGGTQRALPGTAPQPTTSAVVSRSRRNSTESDSNLRGTMRSSR